MLSLGRLTRQAKSLRPIPLTYLPTKRFFSQTPPTRAQLFLPGKTQTPVNKFFSFVTSNKRNLLIAVPVGTVVWAVGLKATLVFIGQSIVCFLVGGLALLIWWRRANARVQVLFPTFVNQLNKNRQRIEKVIGMLLPFFVISFYSFFPLQCFLFSFLNQKNFFFSLFYSFSFFVFPVLLFSFIHLFSGGFETPKNKHDVKVWVHESPDPGRKRRMAAYMYTLQGTRGTQ